MLTRTEEQFGQIAIERGYISTIQLVEAVNGITAQAESGKARSTLDEFLLKKGIISVVQRKLVLQACEGGDGAGAVEAVEPAAPEVKKKKKTAGKKRTGEKKTGDKKKTTGKKKRRSSAEADGITDTGKLRARRPSRGGVSRTDSKTIMIGLGVAGLLLVGVVVAAVFGFAKWGEAPPSEDPQPIAGNDTPDPAKDKTKKSDDPNKGKLKDQPTELPPDHPLTKKLIAARKTVKAALARGDVKAAEAAYESYRRELAGLSNVRVFADAAYELQELINNRNKAKFDKIKADFKKFITKGDLEGAKTFLDALKPEAENDEGLDELVSDLEAEYEQAKMEADAKKPPKITRHPEEGDPVEDPDAEQDPKEPIPTHQEPPEATEKPAGPYVIADFASGLPSGIQKFRVKPEAVDLGGGRKGMRATIQASATWFLLLPKTPKSLAGYKTLRFQARVVKGSGEMIATVLNSAREKWLIETVTGIGKTWKQIELPLGKMTFGKRGFDWHAVEGISFAGQAAAGETVIEITQVEFCPEKPGTRKDKLPAD